MSDEDLRRAVLAVAEGEADDLARARVEDDPARRAEAQELAAIVGVLRAAEPELPPPQLRGSILAALEAEPGPAPATSSSWGWIWRLGLAGAAAAVLLGVGIGGGGWGLDPAPPPLQVRAGVQVAAWEGPGTAPGALSPGDRVRVPEGARATLDWRGRGEVELAGGSVAVLDEHAVELVEGTLISTVDPEDDVGFQVRTEDAVVSVVGTRFRVTYEPERGTEVEVFEGEVRVEDLRSHLVRMLTPALRAIWQAWNVDGEERPGRPPPATRPATRPVPPPSPPAPPPELPDVASKAGGDPGADDATPDATGDAEDPSTDEDTDAEAEDVASKPGDDAEEEDEPEDPSYVPADTVEQGF